MRLSHILSILFIAVACSTHSPYPGFSKAKHGIHIQLHKIGEDEYHPEYGDYITADIVYETMQDSIFFTGRRKLKLTKPVYKGAIEECFRMLSNL